MQKKNNRKIHMLGLHKQQIRNKRKNTPRNRRNEDELVEDRRKLRQEVHRLTEENADLLRTKARTMERLKTGEISLK